MLNSTAQLNLPTEEAFESDLDGVLAGLQNTGFEWDDYDLTMTEYDESVPHNIQKHDLINILGRTFNV